MNNNGWNAREQLAQSLRLISSTLDFRYLLSGIRNEFEDFKKIPKTHQVALVIIKRQQQLLQTLKLKLVIALMLFHRQKNISDSRLFFYLCDFESHSCSARASRSHLNAQRFNWPTGSSVCGARKIEC